MRKLKTLDDLLDYLLKMQNKYSPQALAHGTDWSTEAGIELCDLPTFSGTEPSDTSAVWSWDKNRVLVGSGDVNSWKIEPRCPHGDVDFHCPKCE